MSFLISSVLFSYKLETGLNLLSHVHLFPAERVATVIVIMVLQHGDEGYVHAVPMLQSAEATVL